MVEVLENRALLSTFPVNNVKGQSILSGRQFPALPSPGPVMLTDLSRDGIPDLTVADTASSIVLIYRGLGNGKLSPPIAITHAFPAGTNPVGIIVADLTGDGLPEVVIAREGSNDVLILLNQSQRDSLSFTTGSRLNVGSGPDSIVVSDFDGDGIPDILVNRGGSDGVTLFLGVGGGAINGQYSVVFSLGSQPGSISAGKFDGRPDLAVVDPEANVLGRIADVSGPERMTGSSFPGDLDPATAVGFLRAGTLALFDGGSKGVSPMFTETGLLDPMELAFSALTGGQGRFYTAPAGDGLAGLVALGLGVDSALPISTTESSNTMARLVPLHESSLALVATVLAFANDASGNELMVGLGQADVTTGAAFLPGESVPLGQQRSQRVDEEGPVRASGEDPVNSTGAASNPSRSSFRTWERFVIGLDEALDGFRRDNQRPFAEDQDRNPGKDQEVSHPPAGSSSRDEPKSGRPALEPGAGDRGHRGNRGEAPTREAETIEPTEASLPLVSTLMITGWMFIARSSGADRKTDQAGQS